jgi:hypothetical protein
LWDINISSDSRPPSKVAGSQDQNSLPGASETSTNAESATAMKPRNKKRKNVGCVDVTSEKRQRIAPIAFSTRNPLLDSSNQRRGSQIAQVSATALNPRNINSNPVIYKSEDIQIPFGVRDILINTKNGISRIRAIIKFIIVNYRRECNAMQPSAEACRILELLIKMKVLPKFSEMTNSEWMEIMGDTNILYSGFSNKTGIIHDQTHRSFEIFHSLFVRKSKRLLLMDGHGRMIQNVLNHLKTYNKDIDEYKFFVCDIDEHVHKWHTLFLPRGCRSLFQDILELERYPPVVYLNFCGLTNVLVNNNMKLISKMKKIVLKTKGDLFFSSSKRGVKEEKISSKITEFWWSLDYLLKSPQLNNLKVSSCGSYKKFITLKFEYIEPIEEKIQAISDPNSSWSSNSSTMKIKKRKVIIKDEDN